MSMDPDTTTRAREDRWASLERFAPLTGVVAMLLWLIGVFILERGDTPDDDTTALEVVRYFENEEVTIYVAGVLLFLGAILLVWFAGSLRQAIEAAEAGVARLASIAFGATLATAILAMSNYAPEIAGAFAANENDAPLTPGAAQALWAVGDGFFVAAEFTVALLMVATAVATFRYRVFPVWLAWLSLVLALILVIPPIGWAGLIFGFPIWTVIVAVLLYLRGAPRTT